MTNWDERFLDLARYIADRWSKDPSTKVGAVIVDQKRRIVGTGYNGFPRGVADSEHRLNDRTIKYAMVVHAEANAILNSTQLVAGCTLYVTMFPCCECAKLIIQAGIRKVVSPVPGAERWQDSHRYATQMLQEAGVIMQHVTLEGK